MLEAVVFDMDGVIADTEKFHTEARNQILSENGIEMEKDLIEKKFAGVSSEKMFRKVFNKHDVNRDPEKAAIKKREKYTKLLQGNIKPIEGVEILVKELSEDFSLAIASSSGHGNIEKIMTVTGLDQYFQEKVSAKEEGLRGKPSPDVYLEAAKRLGIEPEKCVAIEDGVNGMKSAKRAGMTLIAYSEEAKDMPADHVIKDFANLTKNKIKKIKEMQEEE